jgi:hypothetical protein
LLVWNTATSDPAKPRQKPGIRHSRNSRSVQKPLSPIAPQTRTTMSLPGRLTPSAVIVMVRLRPGPVMAATIASASVPPSSSSMTLRATFT